MKNGFTKGIVLGGLIGASVGMMMNGDIMKSRTGRRIVKSGRMLIKKSGGIISDVADIFR